MSGRTPQEITKLCEAWWARLAASAKIEQHPVAAQVLALLGWADADPIVSQAEWAGAATSSFVLRAGPQTALAAHFVMPGALEPPASILERGLDFCETTRILVNATADLNVPHAFITDLYRSYLYDVQTDELLMCANTPAEFSREFTSVLSQADVEQGALESVRRAPRSYAARQLREWRQRWCAQLCVVNPILIEETAILAMDRLMVIGFLLEHNVLPRNLINLPRRIEELLDLAMDRNPQGCGAGLVDICRRLQGWGAHLFGGMPHVDDVLSRDEVAAPLLREFALMSRGKFTTATILESFNYGEPAEKARVRMVPGEDEERERLLAKWTLDTVETDRLEIDIKEEGYRSVLHWYDKLVALYQRLGVEYEAREEPAPFMEEHADLFSWAEQTASKPRAFTEPRLYAAEQGLLAYYSSARQQRTTRLLLYLHIIGRHYQVQETLFEFPDIEQAIQPRPSVIEADRRWMQTAMQGGYQEESDVV